MPISRWTRLRRHLLLASISGLLILLVYALVPPPDPRHRLSMASAYASLFLLGWTLALGPWNLLRSRHNPVSFNLRRDVGIWAGLLAILHTAVGLTVHLRGRTWMYFFRTLHPVTLQNTRFGFANDMGLLATLLFLGLLLISNDLSLRWFGTRRWKVLQRTTYLALALTLLHGWAFQSVEKRALPWVAVFWFMAAIVTILQLAGFRWRRSLDARTQRILKIS